MCDEYDLMSCESCAQSDIQYTYFHDSLGRHSVIDHVFVDKSICGNVIKYETIDSGVNLSDHVPISCTLAIRLGADSGEVGQHCNNRKNTVGNVLRWDKGDRSMYYNITGQLLQGLRVPYVLLISKCNDQTCCHKSSINRFYKELIDIMQYATKCSVPSVRCDAFKPYWNEELQQLKEDSVQAHLACTDSNG